MTEAERVRRERLERARAFAAARGGASRKRRKTIGELAWEYLKANGFPFVCRGDQHLLHEIAEYAGLGHRSWRTEKQVLDALDSCPRFFRKTYFRGPGNRVYRCYDLREEEVT